MNSELEVANPEKTVFGVLCTMDETGDSPMQWDKNNPEQVAKARGRFDDLIKQGYLGYKVNAKGDKGSVLSAFDPSAERIIMAPPMVGG